MSDTLVTIIGIFLAAVLLFVFPLMTISNTQDNIAQVSVQSLVAEFVNNASTKGKITQDDYNTFISKLYATGNTYDVQLEHKKMTTNPNKGAEDKLGENLYYSVYNSSIVDSTETGLNYNEEYLMKKGDYIIVTVKNTNTTISSQIKSYVYSVMEKDTYKIAASSSALVVNTGSGNANLGVSNDVNLGVSDDVNKDKELISKTEEYVGCYADVDGDGDVDGVIYADLAVGKTGDGTSYTYTIPTESGLKDYYVSGTADGKFGNGVEVLTATGEGNDRFYVMALSDVSTSYSTWYDGKHYDGVFSPILSSNFGNGKTNTATMIEIWNSDTDEEKSSNDVWGLIQSHVNEGWFVPSYYEWNAFLGELGISNDTHSSYGLSTYYFTSNYGPIVQFDYPGSFHAAVALYETCFIRLSTTF